MTATLVSLAASLAMTLTALGLGRPLVRGLGLARDDRFAETVWSLGLGWILAGTFVAVLGVVGGLSMTVVGLLTVAGCFAGLGQLSASPEILPADDSLRTPPPPRWLLWCAGLLTLAAVVGSLVSALAPPTAGDALCYHLELPKRFLAEHRLVYLPYNDNATFPLLAEMWYAWGLALEGPVTAQLVHWQMGLLLAAAGVALARPLIGRPWAWMVGAAIVLVPGVTNQMTAPLNDVALAMCLTLATAAWWQAVVAEEHPNWFIALGLSLGGAMGTKYLALLFVVAAGSVGAWRALRTPAMRRRIVRGAAVASVVAASVAGLWYVRAAWYRGNPVYPFFSEVIKPADHAETLETLPETKAPMGRSPLQLLASPWLITMQPERFGGRGHQLGVLALAVLPGLLWARRLRGLGSLFAIAGIYWLVWFLLRQNVRFLLPVAPLLMLAVVWVGMEMPRLPVWPRRVVFAAVGLIVAFNALLPVARCHRHLAVATGWEDRRTYLLREEPSFSAAELSARLLEPGAKILTQDYRTFYFDQPITRENIYRRVTGYDRRISAGQLSQTLRGAGFTHVLLMDSAASAVRHDETLAKLVAGQRAADPTAIEQLLEYRITSTDGASRRYRLVELR